MRGDARHMDASRGDLHDQDHIIGHEALPRDHFDGAAVGRCEDFPVTHQELRPTHARLAALRSWLSMVPAQDVPHCA